MMRAWAIDRHGDMDQIQLRQLERPRVAPGSILVRVHAAALNPADTKVLSGRDGGRFLHASKFPLVLGFDFSGVVEQLGPHAQGVQLGDEVYGFLPYSRRNRQGSFAEYVCVPTASVGLKPSRVSHVEAACAATVASTALQALHDKARMKSGHNVLVNGASGGVGLCAVQLAKSAGAQVWGTSSAAKADQVMEVGADQVIDYRSTPIGRIDASFDTVFDAASTSSFSACTPILRRGGTYVTLLPSLAFFTGLAHATLTGRRCRLLVVRSCRKDLQHLAALMAEGKLRAVVGGIFPFEGLPQALDHMKSHSTGKVAITVVDDVERPRQIEA